MNAAPQRTADLLAAFSFATDLALGVPAGHGVRSCYLSMRIAAELGLPVEDRVAVYYTALLKDAGCTSWTSALAAFWMADEILARREILVYGRPADFDWFSRFVASGASPEDPRTRFARMQHSAPAFMGEGFASTCEVAMRVAERLRMPESVRAALGAIFEQWDGSGAPRGLRGGEIPVATRVVFPTTFFEVLHGLGGREAACEAARRQRGTAFDPAVVDAFLSLAPRAEFWEPLEGGDLWPDVLALEPASSVARVPAEAVDDLALAFADFADLKSPHLAAHSRRIAGTAESIAQRLRLPPAEVSTIRRAALTHDIGLVAVPSFVLSKPVKGLLPAEWEQLRLHPYHSERVLARLPLLASEAAILACHHERLDGQGYHRGLHGLQIPVGARILAVADRFDDLTHATPDHPALDPGEAAKALARETGHDLWPEAVEALQSTLGTDLPSPRRRQWPAGLTSREIEVLRLASRGLTRGDIAGLLVVSESTVRHHLEHIYDKIGVSTRIGATLYAMEHGLLD